MVWVRAARMVQRRMPCCLRSARARPALRVSVPLAAHTAAAAEHDITVPWKSHRHCVQCNAAGCATMARSALAHCRRCLSTSEARARRSTPTVPSTPKRIRYTRHGTTRTQGTWPIQPKRLSPRPPMAMAARPTTAPTILPPAERATVLGSAAPRRQAPPPRRAGRAGGAAAVEAAAAAAQRRWAAAHTRRHLWRVRLRNGIRLGTAKTICSTSPSKCARRCACLRVCVLACPSTRPHPITPSAV